MHVVQLYEDHVEPNLYAHCSKLTGAHIDLTSFSQMKVNLAAQVLSNSVAHGLEHLYGAEVQGTATFITQMNKLFDSLNTPSLGEHERKRNDNLKPYTEELIPAWNGY